MGSVDSFIAFVKSKERLFPKLKLYVRKCFRN